MPKLAIQLLAPGVLLAALLVQSSSKPCGAFASRGADSLLTKGRVAMGIAGTQRVALDPSGSCLHIQVRTPGTARLVALLLRGLAVPADAVRFQVVS
jgi:hypothetical protein